MKTSCKKAISTPERQRTSLLLRKAPLPLNLFAFIVITVVSCRNNNDKESKLAKPSSTTTLSPKDKLRLNHKLRVDIPFNDNRRLVFREIRLDNVDQGNLVAH